MKNIIYNKLISSVLPFVKLKISNKKRKKAKYGKEISDKS